MTIPRSSLPFLGILLLAGCGASDQGPRSTAAPATTAAPPTTVATAPVTPSTPDLPGLESVDAAAITGYLGWTELATPPPDPVRTTAGGAHGTDTRIWASPTAGRDSAAAKDPYPRGSVVVKEGRTGDTVTLIAIMEKVRASDAATGGWRYAEYKRSSAGQELAKVAFPESGCAGCHMRAKDELDTDWVYFTR